MESVNWYQFMGGIGIGFALCFAIQKSQKYDSPSSKPKNESDDDSEWEDASSDPDTSDDESLAKLSATGPTKMILAVRTDLKMGKGKIAAQCSHAAVAAFKKANNNCKDILRAWEQEGSRKIAVKINSEDEMQTIFAIAKSLGLVTAIIQDAGRTQVDPGSKTVVAVGPGPDELIDQVTKHLALL